MENDRHGRAGRGWCMSVTRIWLPLAIALAGVVLIVIGHGRYSNLANSNRWSRPRGWRCCSWP